MLKTLIKNIKIVNEGEIFTGSVLIDGEFIKRVVRGEDENLEAEYVIDGYGRYLLPGIIDDHVHFRDPGLTHKGDLYTESKTAVAGGITSFMEMPNTVPRALSQELLEEKYKIASNKSLANYSFYIGTSNDNIDEVLKTNPDEICGIKMFLGASTGDMLVDNQETIKEILKFSAKTGIIVTCHCEEESVIQANSQKYKEKYGEELDPKYHPEIRSREACYLSSFKIVKLARELEANLHVLHLTTADEIALFDKGPIREKKITVEACIHHLWFSDEDYASKGSFIKWNPAVKSIKDRDALQLALNNDQIDIIATDHAPHTLEEKSNKNYFQCAAGGPLVQHLLPALLELEHKGIFSLEKIVEKTSHNPALRFKIEKRGFIREGYYADLTIVNLNAPWTVNKSNVLYKCAWSPFEGTFFHSQVTHTFVNGNLVYDNGNFNEGFKGQRLHFERSKAVSVYCS